jgi:hypothetical protein
LQPKNFKFGGGVADTILNPAVLIVILIIGVLILVWPRKKIIGPFIAAALLIPMDQVLVLGGLHFPMLRLLALFGIARLVRERFVAKHRIFAGGINKIDLSLILFTLFTAIAGVLLFRESGELIYQIGNIYTVFGLYFLLRFLLRDESDVLRLVRTFVLCAIPIALVMTWEAVTGHNPYAVLGGARASVYAISEARSGRFRAQGSFGNSILAGTFGAILLPLSVLLWRSGKKNRIAAIAGIIAATVITAASNSSTPMLAYAAGVAALGTWPIRNWMRVIRWGTVTTAVLLHMVMKAPVWHLIARIDISGGSSSDHRFQLVDQCIRHFGDWWLVGVKSTAEWGWDMFDTANQYVNVCDNSGLLPFILFMAIIVYGYKFLGKARKAAPDRKRQFFFWALGASLFAHTIAFIGVSYWDQMQFVWYTLLAAISAAVLMNPKRVPAILSAPSGAGVDPSFADNGYQLADPADEAAVGARRQQSSRTFPTF